MTYELTTEDVVVDAVGEPGRRVFYVQAREGARTVTLKAEKQQVAALAEQLVEILDRLTESQGPDPVEPTPDFRLVDPLVPLFAIGSIAVGYDEDRDLVLLQFEELSGEEEPDIADEPETVRIWASRTRTRSLAVHSAGVVGSGRPLCELCGFPKEDPHVCPRSNGHGSPG